MKWHHATWGHFRANPGLPTDLGQCPHHVMGLFHTPHSNTEPSPRFLFCIASLEPLKLFLEYEEVHLPYDNNDYKLLTS